MITSPVSELPAYKQSSDLGTSEMLHLRTT